MPAGNRNSGLWALLRAIVAGDATAAIGMLAASPELARQRAETGASRLAAKDYFLVEIGHYVYSGDTALHIAAAAYQKSIAMKLVARGADVRAKNRRGAEPLHYAADGAPGSCLWNSLLHSVPSHSAGSKLSHSAWPGDFTPWRSHISCVAR